MDTKAMIECSEFEIFCGKFCQVLSECETVGSSDLKLEMQDVSSGSSKNGNSASFLDGAISSREKPDTFPSQLMSSGFC